MSSDKQLTEKEAWLYLAELFDKPKIDYLGGYYITIGFRYSYGLCACIANLETYNHIVKDVRHAMQERLYNFMGNIDTYLYLYPLNYEGTKQRAALCRKFAEEC